MELKIVSNIENKTLGRREIVFQVAEGAVAKRFEVQAELCKALNLKPEGTVVVEMGRRFGERQLSCTAHSYESKGLMERFEPRYLLDRVSGNKRKPGAAKEEKKAAPEGEKK